MKKYAPNPELSKNAHVTNMDEYKKLYENSINNPEGFWEEQANRISWFKKWNKVWDWNFDDAYIKWFEGA